ncbi:MAG: DUF6516 family protein [Candidatus Hydrothermarchaeota archaeon]|nr:DUF6516 family protein [Candidatus Hydrothermarchaeota archaeon]
MIEDYLAELKALLTTSRITLIDDSTLFFTEYSTSSKDKIFRDKYSFHWQKRDKMIIRWDNAPHHREISTFPHHAHKGGRVLRSKEMTLEKVLEVIEKEMGQEE